MRYQTYKLILAREKNRSLYDCATSTGTDGTTDATAKTVDPNQYLAPLIGGSPVIRALVIVSLVLLIIYLSKSIFYGVHN